MKQKYYTSSHAKYLIRLHFVFVVKYRKKLLFNPIDNSLKDIITEVCQRYDFTLDVMETDKDHIHILVDLKPTQSAFEFVSRAKSMTTFHLWKRHPEILKRYFFGKIGSPKRKLLE